MGNTTNGKYTAETIHEQGKPTGSDNPSDTVEKAVYFRDDNPCPVCFTTCDGAELPDHPIGMFCRTEDRLRQRAVNRYFGGRVRQRAADGHWEDSLLEPVNPEDYNLVDMPTIESAVFARLERFRLRAVRLGKAFRKSDALLAAQAMAEAEAEAKAGGRPIIKLSLYDRPVGAAQVTATPVGGSGPYPTLPVGYRVRVFDGTEHDGNVAEVVEDLGDKARVHWEGQRGKNTKIRHKSTLREMDGSPLGSKADGKPGALTDAAWDAMSEEDLGIISGETVNPEPVSWTWPGRIAKKKMNMVAGEGKQGKTQLVLAMGATTSTGAEWPDGSGRAELGTVIILSAEDDPEDTLAPRLIALGADMARIKILRSEYTIKQPGKEPTVNPITFQDLAYWRAIFRRYPDCRLFIVDPLPSYLGRGVNDHKNVELRQVMTPFLRGVLAAHDIAMVAVTHVNKSLDPNKPAAHRIMGSLAYGNLARSIHFVARDQADRDLRLFAQSDNTSAGDLPAVAFRLKPRMVANREGHQFEVWVPEFEKETRAVDVNEVVNGGAKKGPKPTKSRALAEWLWNRLQPGPAAIHDLVELARTEGLLPKPSPQNLKPSISPLYAAKDLIPVIHTGWEVRDAEVYQDRGDTVRAYKAWEIHNPSVSEPEFDPDQPF